MFISSPCHLFLLIKRPFKGWPPVAHPWNSARSSVIIYLSLSLFATVIWPQRKVGRSRGEHKQDGWRPDRNPELQNWELDVLTISPPLKSSNSKCKHDFKEKRKLTVILFKIEARLIPSAPGQHSGRNHVGPFRSPHVPVLSCQIRIFQTSPKLTSVSKWNWSRLPRWKAPTLCRWREPLLFAPYRLMPTCAVVPDGIKFSIPICYTEFLSVFCHETCFIFYCHFCLPAPCLQPVLTSTL